MKRLTYIYISSQEEGLAVFGPYDYMQHAEHALLVDLLDSLSTRDGTVITPNDEVLADAWSETGYVLNNVLTDDVRMYLRKLTTEVTNE